MKLSAAAKAVNGTLQGEDISFHSVSQDTRTLKPGDLYVALNGPNNNGHDFINYAEVAGAVAAIVSESIQSRIPILKVSDTHQALIDLAGYHRNQLTLPVIAITGSCGKTTTKTLLASILAQQGKVLSNQSSYNNDIGVPLTLLRLDSEHEYAVCEMGANHPGEIAKLTHLVQPDVAIITNAVPAHLEGFGDLDGVACAKGEIFQGLSVKGTAIINNDDHYAAFWKKRVGAHRTVTFAMNHSADVMAKDIQCNESVQPIFRLILPHADISVQLQLMGEHNVMNALAAAAAAFTLSIPIEKIKKGLESAGAVNKRLIAKIGFSGAIVIDDSYNANPRSVTAAMAVLAHRSGTSILVLGDMLEMGDHSDQFHRELGEKALSYGIDRLYCYGQHSRFTAEAFGGNALYFENQRDL